MQNVIHAIVVAGLLDGGDVGWLFHDANQALVAGGAGAVDAGIDIGDVVADGTEMQTGLQLADGVGEELGVFVAGAQDVKSEALRSLAAYAGKFLEFVDEASHGLGKLGQRDLGSIL